MNTVDPILTDRTREISIKPISPAPSNNNSQSLRDYVETAVSNYFQHLEGQDVTNVYEMVLSEVETPLLEVVMKYTRHNQTRAAEILGLNRGTLRKKLKQYGLL
jgi:Fis family transcriptional regulator, factor for inversion stimulation protein